MDSWRKVLVHSWLESSTGHRVGRGGLHMHGMPVWRSKSDTCCQKIGSTLATLHPSSYRL
jgi:hypothetical protein